MRILFIRSTGGVSGAEIYTIRLAQALAKKNHTVSILTDNPQFHTVAREKGLDTAIFHPRIPEVGTKRELCIALVNLPKLIPAWITHILSLEQKKKFDCIVLESMTEKLFLTFFLRQKGYRVVWIEHGPLYRTPRSWIVKKCYRLVSTWTYAIIAVSKDTKHDLLQGGLDEEKVHAIYLGIDMKRSMRERRGQIDKRNRKKYWVIGYFGSVVKEKGIYEFLHLAQHIGENHAYASFSVIGGGIELAGAKKEAKMMRLTHRIQFHGYQKNPFPYLQKLDILFVPTLHEEGLSLAIEEAMSLGIIVVARDIGGNRELIQDRKTGFLFRSNSEGYKLIDDIIKNRLSISAIQKAARAHIEKNFSMDTQVGKFIHIFHG